MHNVYLGLGSNLGNKEKNLLKAIDLIDLKVGKILRQSTFHSSKPDGFDSTNDFLNAVILIATNLTPHEVLHQTQAIEKSLGRKNKSTNGYTDRIIDIDILIFDSLSIDTPELTIPHPLINQRDFVLNPLLEIEGKPPRH